MRNRLLTPELMDDPALDPAEHRRALAGLNRLNVLSRAARPVCSALLAMWRERQRDGQRAGQVAAGPISIVDIATGGGDLLVELARELPAALRGRLIGVDISRTALATAQQNATAAGIAGEWLASDVVRDGLPMENQSVDFAVCSLFLHHLKSDEVVRVLKELARISRIGIIISDLRRSRTGLLLAASAGRIVTRSPIVHADSVKSVRAAWTQGELAQLAAAAGLDNARVERIWPYRLLLSWQRSNPLAGATTC